MSLSCTVFELLVILYHSLFFVHIYSTHDRSASDVGTSAKKTSSLPMFGRIKTSAIAKPAPKDTTVSGI